MLGNIPQCTGQPPQHPHNTLTLSKLSAVPRGRNLALQSCPRMSHGDQHGSETAHCRTREVSHLLNEVPMQAGSTSVLYRGDRVPGKDSSMQQSGAGLPWGRAGLGHATRRAPGAVKRGGDSFGWATGCVAVSGNVSWFMVRSVKCIGARGASAKNSPDSVSPVVEPPSLPCFLGQWCEGTSAGRGPGTDPPHTHWSLKGPFSLDSGRPGFPLPQPH